MERYNPIEKGFDPLINSEYLMYAIPLHKIKVEAMSWYGEGFNFMNFDNRRVKYENEKSKAFEIKQAGILCNIIFAYAEDGKYYLLDGFNRLFTDYAEIELNPIVYVKILTTRLADHKLMEIMFKLNLWKLYSADTQKFRLNDFLDRGFRLLMKSKFNIEIYNFENYHERLKNRNDIEVLEKYFVREVDFADSFKHEYNEVRKLLSHPNVVTDFRNIIKANDYLESPFSNYHMFVNGYIYFLSHLRLNGNQRDNLTIDFFIDKLYANKKFFTKLKSMAGNEFTRKNIYKFFRSLNLDV